MRPWFVLKQFQGNVLTSVEWLQLWSHVSGISIKSRNQLPQGEVRNCYTGTCAWRSGASPELGAALLRALTQLVWLSRVHSWAFPGLFRGSKTERKTGMWTLTISWIISPDTTPQSLKGDYIVKTAIFLLPTRQAETVQCKFCSEAWHSQQRITLTVFPAGSPPLWFLPSISPHR